MFANKFGESHDNSQRSQEGSKEGTNLDLLLTGDRHMNRVCVYFHGHAAMIPCALLDALVKALAARIETAAGYCEISRGTVLRLRQAIDACAGSGVGKQLIETGFKGEYRLTIPMNEIVTRVAVTACFFELVDLAVISPAHAATVRQACRICLHPETGLGPRGD